MAGSACGTGPLTAVWKLTLQASTSGNVLTTKKVNFRSANPSPVYVSSYTNVQNLKASVRLTVARPSSRMSLVVKATRSFSKITYIPKTTAVVARLVKSCP